MHDGAIDFALASGLSVGAPAFTSTPVGLSYTSVQVTRVRPQTHELEAAEARASATTR